MRFIASWGLRMSHICPCTPCPSPQVEKGQRSKVVILPTSAYMRALLVSQDRRHLFVTPCMPGTDGTCTKEHRRAAQEMSYLFFLFYGVAVGLCKHSVRLWCATEYPCTPTVIFNLLHPYLKSSPPLPASISWFTHGLFLMIFISLSYDWNSHWSLLSCRICTNCSYST
jgi:hypothetical protein